MQYGWLWAGCFSSPFFPRSVQCMPARKRESVYRAILHKLAWLGSWFFGRSSWFSVGKTFHFLGSQVCNPPVQCLNILENILGGESHWLRWMWVPPQQVAWREAISRGADNHDKPTTVHHPAPGTLIVSGELQLVLTFGRGGREHCRTRKQAALYMSHADIATSAEPYGIWSPSHLGNRWPATSRI